MSKKFFALFVALAMILSASAASAVTDSDTVANYTIEYTLDEDGGITETIGEPGSTPGGNFKQIYQLSTLTLNANVSMDVNSTYTKYLESNKDDVEYTKKTYKWEVKSIKSGDTEIKTLNYSFGKDASGNDILTVSGILPDSAAVISLDLVATVTSIDKTGIDLDSFLDYITEDEDTQNRLKNFVLTTLAKHGTGTSFEPDTLTIEVDAPDAMVIIQSDDVSFDVKPASGVSLDTVAEGYSVTVNAYSRTDEVLGTIYVYYLAAEDDLPVVELPTWLMLSTDSVKTKTVGGETVITSFDIVYKGDAQIEKGTKGRVRVKLLDSTGEEFDNDTYLQWDVVYNGESEVVEPRPFGVSGSGEVSLNKTASSDVKTFTYKASLPTPYKLASYSTTGDINSFVSSVTSTDLNSDNEGTISVKFAIPSGATLNAGTTNYTGSLVFYDTNTASASIAVNIKVTSDSGGTSGFELVASPTVLTLASGGSGSVAITVSGDTSRTLTWTAAEVTGLTITTSDTSSTGATVNVTASAEAAKENPVKVVATDSAGNASSVTFRVLVDASYSDIIAGIADKIKALVKDTASDVKVFTETAQTADSSSASIIASLSDDFAALDPAEAPVIALPELSGDLDSATYVFPLSWDAIAEAISDKKLVVGEKIFIHMIPDGEEVSSEDKGVFFDDSGTEITVVPSVETKINIAAKLDAEVDSYRPVISKYKLTTVTLSGDSSVSIEQGETKTLTFKSNKTAASWSVTDSDSAFDIGKTENGDSVTVDLLAYGETTVGTHNITVTAADADGTEASMTLAITITANTGGYDFSITGIDHITITKGAAAQEITLDASKGKRRRALTFSVENYNEGLTFERKSGDTSRTAPTFTLSAASTMSDDDYLVSVIASDGTDEYEHEITVTVTGGVTPTPTTGFSIIALGNLELSGTEAQSVTVRVSSGTPSGTITWTYGTVEGLTISMTNTANTEAVVYVSAPSSFTGTKTVYITATDSAGNSARTDFSVTYSSSGGGDAPGGGEATKVSTFSTPSATAQENFATPSVVSAIVNAIVQKMGGSGSIPADVLSKGFTQIPDDAISAPVDLTELISSGDRSIYVHYYVLPTLTLTEPGLYFTAVPTGTFSGREGYTMYAKIFKDVTPVNSGALANEERKMELASTETNSAVLTNDAGTVISFVPEDGVVNIGAYFSEAGIYSPLIEVSTVSGDMPSSGAGCSGGFGALTGVLALAFTGSAVLIRRKEN